MSVVQVTASPNHWANEYSGYGGIAWWPGPYANIAVGQGTAWVIWQVGVSGLNRNESFNGINASGKCSFKVGTGAGVSRTATLYCKATNNYNSIPGSSGGVVGTYPPSGANLDTVCPATNSSISSNDLIAGNFYFCVAVSTASLDGGAGDGTFNYGALTFTIYTGADQPNPPASQPAGKWNNPAGNNDPGVYPGQSFASVNYRLTSPLPQTFFSQQFQIFGAVTNTITFPNGTSTSPLYTKGLQGTDPTHPYDSDTGVIQVASTVPPGVYSLRCQSANGSGLGGAGLLDYTSLTVRQRPSSGIYLMEF